jgi:integrase/recombinase XerC
MSRLIVDHLAWMRLAAMSARTIDARERFLYRLDKALPFGLAYASADELSEAIGRMATEGRWGTQTQATYSRHVRGFYRWAILVKRLAEPDPSDVLPKPRVGRRRPRPVRDDLLTRILTEAAEPYRMWAVLAAYGGLRACEIGSICREDIDERGIWLRGKGDADGWVPMHPAIWDAVKDLPPGPVARKRSGEPATGRYVSMAWWRHVNRDLGVSTSIHKLRHWCATKTLQGTGNLAVVQRLMRHASMNTTLGYAEILDADVSAAVAALPLPGGVQ